MSGMRSRADERELCVCEGMRGRVRGNFMDWLLRGDQVGVVMRDRLKMEVNEWGGEEEEEVEREGGLM